MTNQNLSAATALQTAVTGINLNNDYSKRVISDTVGQLKKYIGQTIFKADGSLLKKIEFERMKDEVHTVNAFGFDFYIRSTFYLEVKYNNYRVICSTTVAGGGYDANGVNKNYYRAEDFFNLFVVNDGKLVSIIDEDRTYLSEVIDHDQIISDKQEVERKALEYDQAVKKIPQSLRSVLMIKH